MAKKAIYFFPMAQQPIVGQDILIIEASLWHSAHRTQ